MAWTTPVDQATGFLVTAAVYNAQIIDNLKYLHGDGGAAIDVSAGGQPFGTARLIAFAASGSPSVGNYLVSGDANPAWQFLGSGAWQIGPGGASAVDTTLQRSQAGILLLSSATPGDGNFIVGGVNANVSVPTTYTPGARRLLNKATVTAGGAATLTVAAPVDTPTSTQTALIVVRIANSGGGTITLSWNAAYVANGTTALPASLANGAISTCLFFWDGSVSKWVLMAVN